MQNASLLGTLIIATLVVAACSANRPSEPATFATGENQPGSLLDNARAGSCPEGQRFLPAQDIEISVTPIVAENAADLDEALGNARAAGIWHLESPEPNFGGLSGLAVASANNLLAVTDQGAFVSISLQDGVPTGSGSIGYMRGQDGQPLSGKGTSDSEGLHIVDGLALVSFERDHRISAFDLSGCGVAAREVMLTRVPTSRNANQGLEALTLRSDVLLAGWEKTSRGLATLERFDTDTGLNIGELELKAPDGLNLTGLDQIGDRSFAVFRAYSPIKGNTIEVRRYDDISGEGEMIVRLQRPLPVDNFEGIAAIQMDEGTLRIYIVSDDNFSASQRTLLMAFDITSDAR